MRHRSSSAFGAAARRPRPPPTRTAVSPSPAELAKLALLAWQGQVAASDRHRRRVIPGAAEGVSCLPAVSSAELRPALSCLLPLRGHDFREVRRLVAGSDDCAWWACPPRQASSPSSSSFLLLLAPALCPICSHLFTSTSSIMSSPRRTPVRRRGPFDTSSLLGSLPSPGASPRARSEPSVAPPAPSSTYLATVSEPAKTLSPADAAEKLSPLVVVLSLNETLLFRPQRTTKGSVHPIVRPYLATFLSYLCATAAPACTETKGDDKKPSGRRSSSSSTRPRARTTSSHSCARSDSSPRVRRPTLTARAARARARARVRVRARVRAGTCSSSCARARRWVCATKTTAGTSSRSRIWTRSGTRWASVTTRARGERCCSRRRNRRRCVGFARSHSVRRWLNACDPAVSRLVAAGEQS